MTSRCFADIPFAYRLISSLFFGRCPLTKLPLAVLFTLSLFVVCACLFIPRLPKENVFVAVCAHRWRMSMAPTVTITPICSIYGTGCVNAAWTLLCTLPLTVRPMRLCRFVVCCHTGGVLASCLFLSDISAAFDCANIGT